MKKQIFTLSFALCAAFGYAQTPNIFPATGMVGLGNTTPSYKLHVTSDNTRPQTGFFYTETLASIGRTLTTGLRFQALGYTVLVPGVGSTSSPAFRLQMTPNGTANTGYIEFSNPATTNSAKAAVSFGHDTSELMRVNQDGKVRIGLGTNDIKTPDGYKLFVEDGILTEKVKVAVKTTTNWADYVFAADYKLMPLNEVEKYTKENNHLPNVPSASQMVENGLDVAQMDAKLLEKVEELTLYLIEQQKQIENLKSEITALKNNKQ